LANVSLILNPKSKIKTPCGFSLEAVLDGIVIGTGGVPPAVCLERALAGVDAGPFPAIDSPASLLTIVILGVLIF
jgi:hypothetical protein